MQELRSRMRHASNSLGKVRILLPIFALVILGFFLLAQAQILTLQAAGETEVSSLAELANEVFLPIIVSNASGEPGGIGIVYRDYNANGTRDTNEPGVPGITVSAYAADGTKAATDVTNAQGQYNLPLSAGQQYRLEVTGIPDYLQPGVVGNSSEATVAFAPAPINNVSFGLNNPADYCQDNPELGTPCYVFGDQSEDLPALISFNNRAGSTALDDNFLPKGNSPYDDANNDVPGIQIHPVEAATNDIGTTNGLAYQRSTDVIFAGAFMKRHSGFGPGGTGTIYRINRAGNSVSVYTDLNAIFGGNTAGANPHDSSHLNDPNAVFEFFAHDPSFDQVGKISLGDIEISEDEKYLYTVNLADKMLYRIPVVSQASPAFKPADIGRFALPAPSNCAASDIRPFALAIEDGTLYAGMVCSAQSTQKREDMRAYVYSFDGNKFSGPVIDFRLDYPRLCADRIPGNPDCGTQQDNKDADWYPWVGTFGEVLEKSGTAGLSDSRLIPIYPQPQLTDIEFANGYMILGLRDRNGDLFGNGAFDPRDANGDPVGFPPTMSSPDTLYMTVSAGDILTAAPAANGWKLENNASVGNLPPTDGANNGNGPGGGEYFFDESFAVVDNDYPRHAEIAQGGLTNIAGQGNAITTSFNPIPIDDPSNFFDGGIIWLSGQDGSRSRSYRIFAGDAPPNNPPIDPTILLQGKNNGLGDLEVFCDQAPLEIGDRVWYDANKNGIQDPGEKPLSGISVQLYAPDMTTLLGTAVTGADGQYYFSNATSGPLSGTFAVYGVAGLKPNTAGYKLRIDQTQPGIANNKYVPARANADGQIDNNNKTDLRDSDAIVSGTFAEIMFNTGGAGHNNHTLDFGFHDAGVQGDPDIDIIKKTNGQDANVPVLPGVPQIAPGDPVTWTYEVANTGGVAFAKENVTVKDNRGVVPIFDKVLVGNNNDLLEPNEVWQYKATGVAEVVSAPYAPGAIPTLWGIDEDFDGLFSVDDYTKIGAGSTAAGLIEWGSLYYQDLDGVNQVIGKHIESFAIDSDFVAYFVRNRDVKLGGAQSVVLKAPVMLKLDLRTVSSTGPIVATVVGSIPIPGFDYTLTPADNVTGLSFDPATGRLHALYMKSDGTVADILYLVSKEDASIIAELGEMRNDALGEIVGHGEEMEYDHVGNLFVSDNNGDQLYKVDPETAKITEVVDNNQHGGLGVTRLKTEGLAWDSISETMLAFDDYLDRFYIQTLENGNNVALGTLPELTDVEGMDFLISCYRNVGIASATVMVEGKELTVNASDVSHYCN